MSAAGSAVADGRSLTSVLVVQAGKRGYAIPLELVSETMRPLPVTPIAGAPLAVQGLSVIRGAPVPVVDLAMLLGSHDPATKSTRFVALWTQGRTFALQVDGVVGIRELDWNQLDELPPVLGANGPVEAISIVDQELLIVLGGARFVPDEIWKNVDAQEEAL